MSSLPVLEDDAISCHSLATTGSNSTFYFGTPPPKRKGFQTENSLSVDDSEVIENTPIKDNRADVKKSKVKTNKKPCTVVSTTEDESNTEAIEVNARKLTSEEDSNNEAILETPAVVNPNKFKTRQYGTMIESEPNKTFDSQHVEGIVSKHIGETKTGTLKPSPALAKNIKSPTCNMQLAHLPPKLETPKTRASCYEEINIEKKRRIRLPGGRKSTLPAAVENDAIFDVYNFCRDTEDEEFEKTKRTLRKKLYIKPVGSEPAEPKKPRPHRKLPGKAKINTNTDQRLSDAESSIHTHSKSSDGSFDKSKMPRLSVISPTYTIFTGHENWSINFRSKQDNIDSKVNTLNKNIGTYLEQNNIGTTREILMEFSADIEEEKQYFQKRMDEAALEYIQRLNRRISQVERKQLRENQLPVNILKNIMSLRDVIDHYKEKKNL